MAGGGGVCQALAWSRDEGRLQCGGRRRTFWHLTPQNHTVWHLLHLSRLLVSPQLAAARGRAGSVSGAEQSRHHRIGERGAAAAGGGGQCRQAISLLPPLQHLPAIISATLTALERLSLLLLVPSGHCAAQPFVFRVSGSRRALLGNMRAVWSVTCARQPNSKPRAARPPPPNIGQHACHPHSHGDSKPVPHTPLAGKQ